MPNRATTRRPARLLTAAVALGGALTVLSAVALWPRGAAPDLDPPAGRYVDARVTAVEAGAVSAELTSGPDAGRVVEVAPGSARAPVPDLAVGDEVVLLDAAEGAAGSRYAFADVQRGSPLLWLAAAFVLAVLVVGRGKGVRSLVGLAVAGAVLVVFAVPALLRDESGGAVAFTAAVAIAFVALYVAHGVNVGTTVAVAGTAVSLAATAALALGVAAAADLTGVAAGQLEALELTAGALDLRGLLVTGIVVGALGVLGDVTVSQVSIVAALRRANPVLSARILYGEAMRVGRDHVTATVNTLVLAYAGASLPLLLLFTEGSNRPAGRLLTSEVVAIEIVRMLVGAIGLVASVPVTTGLAALVLGPGEAEGAPAGPAPRHAPAGHPPAHLAGLRRDER
jgi:uncharacterized membrane protein